MIFLPSFKGGRLLAGWFFWAVACWALVAGSAIMTGAAGASGSAGAAWASGSAGVTKVTSLNQCYDDLPFRGHVQATHDHGGRLESILQFSPDVVFANSFNSPLLIARLRERGLHVVTLPEPQSLAEVAQLFDKLNPYLAEDFDSGVRAFNRPDTPRGEAFGAGRDSKYRSIGGADAAGINGANIDGSADSALAYGLNWPQIWQGKTVLMLQANHYSFGAETLWDEVVRALGGINAAPGVGLVSVLPERVLALDPDVIVTIEGGNFALASRNALHGALAPLVAARGVSIASTLNGCMAQQLGALIEALDE